MNENYNLEDSISDKFQNISEISSDKEQNVLSRNINTNDNFINYNNHKNSCILPNKLGQKKDEYISIRNNNINQNKSDIIDRFLLELENKSKFNGKYEGDDDDEEDEFEKAEREYRKQKNNNSKNSIINNSKQKDNENYSKILNEEFSFIQENSCSNKNNNLYNNKLTNNQINLIYPIYQQFNNKINIIKKQKNFEPKINANPGKIYLNASVKQGGTTFIKKINPNLSQKFFFKIHKKNNKNTHIVNDCDNSDHSCRNFFKINYSKPKTKNEFASDYKPKKDNSSSDKNNSQETFRYNNKNIFTPIYIDGLILQKINNNKQKNYNIKHSNSLIGLKTLKNYNKYNKIFFDNKRKKNKTKSMKNFSTINVMKYCLKNKTKKCNSTSIIINNRNKNTNINYSHYKKNRISQLKKNSNSTINIFNPYSTMGWTNKNNYMSSKNKVNNKYLPIIHDEKIMNKNSDSLRKSMTLLKIANCNKENLINQESYEEINNKSNNNGRMILFKNYGEKNDYIMDSNEILLNKNNKKDDKEEYKGNVLTSRKSNGKINLDGIREVTEEN